MAIWYIFTSGVTSLLLLLAAKRLWAIYVCSSRDRCCSLHLPPGDLGWPLIGNMVSFVIQTARGEDFFMKRRDLYGQVFKMHFLGNPTVRVSGAANVKPILLGEHSHVMSQWPTSVRRLLGPNCLGMSTGDLHRYLRKYVLKAFSQEALGGYLEPLHKMALTQLQIICRKRDVIVYEEMGHYAVSVASTILAGLHGSFSTEETDAIANDFLEFLDGFFTLGINLPGTPHYKALKARQRLVTRLKKTMHQERQGSYFRDALSIILDAHEEVDRKLSEEEVLSLVLELMFAGTSTLRSAMTSVMMHLARHPSVIQGIVEELHNNGMSDDPWECPTPQGINKLVYLNDVIKEVLRLSPPAGGGYRNVIKTLEIGGYQIPKGWTVIYGINNTQQETSERFSYDDTFDPDRWKTLPDDSTSNFNFLSFGAGARACVGKEFAKLQLKVFTVTLVRACHWRVTSSATLMKRLPVLHPKDGLPVSIYWKAEQMDPNSLQSSTHAPTSCRTFKGKG